MEILYFTLVNGEAAYILYKGSTTSSILYLYDSCKIYVQYYSNYYV